MKDKRLPPLNTLVRIKTNWKTYTAKLNKCSIHDGYVFKVCGKKHEIEISTVIDWDLI